MRLPQGKSVNCRSCGLGGSLKDSHKSLEKAYFIVAFALGNALSSHQTSASMMDHTPRFVVRSKKYSKIAITV